MAQSKPLDPEYIKMDLEGVAAITALLPFETQDITRLRKVWQIEETDLGFGGKYLNLVKGRGYSVGYVHALVYNGRIVKYEAGIESYSQWPDIGHLIIQTWKENNGPEASEEEHGLVFRRTLAGVLSKYQSAVAAALGPLNDALVPPGLQKSYLALMDPMRNSTISATDQNEDIAALETSNSKALLANVLRGYNPGARVLAALALLKLAQSGDRLARDVRQSIDKVLDLDIELKACAFDICSHLTAREAFQWFDSRRAFPRSKRNATR